MGYACKQQNRNRCKIALQNFKLKLLLNAESYMWLKLGYIPEKKNFQFVLMKPKVIR